MIQIDPKLAWGALCTIIGTAVGVSIWVGRLQANLKELDLKSNSFVTKEMFDLHYKTCVKHNKDAHDGLCKKMDSMHRRFDGFADEWKLFTRDNNQWKIDISKELASAQTKLSDNGGDKAVNISAGGAMPDFEKIISEVLDRKLKDLKN